MFTGLVEEVGVLRSVEQGSDGTHLRIASSRILDDVKVGDSIAVNGACLTVVTLSESDFVADAVPETMRRTNLGRLRVGDPVNLERALKVGDRLGGHIVSGHIDGVGVIRSIQREGFATLFTIDAPPEILRFVVEKGSICVEGVSLTVMDITATAFRLSIIPHTGEHTSLTRAKVGQLVNLESDLLAKYVEKMMLNESSQAGGRKNRDLDLDYLREHGFA